MARTRRPRQAKAQPQSCLGCLNHFLTPALWRQVLLGWPRRALRWRPQPLLLVLLVMTRCAGDSQAERFETARGFYVASYPRRRRPGRPFEGFQSALARVPARALRLAAAARARLEQVFAACWVVDGFVPLGCDGSTLACPRTPQLERRLRAGTVQDGRPPTVWVTALLPRLALVVTDAGYGGYELLRAIVGARRSFLIRLSSKAPLYTAGRVNLARFREGLACYWPQEAQQQGRPPLAVRVIHLRRNRKGDVWLMPRPAGTVEESGGLGTPRAQRVCVGAAHSIKSPGWSSATEGTTPVAHAPASPPGSLPQRESDLFALQKVDDGLPGDGVAHGGGGVPGVVQGDDLAGLVE
jgi:hypothetical protein